MKLKKGGGRERTAEFQLFHLLRSVLENSNFCIAMEVFCGTGQLYFQYRVNVKISNKTAIWDI